MDEEMNITVNDFKNWLIKAKEEHTLYFGNDPTHDWVTFYAEMMYDEMINAGKQMDVIGKSKTIHDFSSDGMSNRDNLADAIDTEGQGDGC